MEKFTNKPNHHEFITKLDSIQKHNELFSAPHLRSLYSDSFDSVQAAAKQFCFEVTALRMGSPAKGSQDY